MIKIIGVLLAGVLALIISAVLTGCVTTEGPKFSEASSGFTPKLIYEGNLDKIWSAVNRALDDNRIPVVSSDKSSGRIQTDHMQGSTTAYAGGLGGVGNSRYSFNIRVNEEAPNKTKVAVLAKLEQSLTGTRTSTPYRDLTQTNPSIVKNLENWLYEQIEKKL